MPPTRGSRVSLSPPCGIENGPLPGTSSFRPWTVDYWRKSSDTRIEPKNMRSTGRTGSQRMPGEFDTSPTQSSLPPLPGGETVIVKDPAVKSSSPLRDRPIYFYDKDKPHYGFTNFSDHGIMFNGRLYPTSEHLFQSFKFQEDRPDLAERIRTYSNKPSVALSEARRLKPHVRKDWFNVNIQKMDETLRLKFTQHPDLLQELLATGNAELIEDSDKDDFWGIGKKRDGRNELGKALVHLRSELRASALRTTGPPLPPRTALGPPDAGLPKPLLSPQAHSASSGRAKQSSSFLAIMSPSLPRDQPIYFYDRDKPYYGFTNFSDHGIVFEGRLYPTSEHLFQSFKFQKTNPQLAEHIRTYSNKPSIALSEARRLKSDQRKDWFNVNIQKMDETLRHKFNQHPDLLHELLSTGDAELIEDSDKDDFWGIGKKRDGRNELGKALVRLRSELRPPANLGHL